MSSSDLFQFLNDVYDLMPDKDQMRFGELWKAYEQTYGHVWMTMLERKASASINYLPLYNNLRWLKHKFDSTSQIKRSAYYRNNQDVSKGLDLSLRYLVKFSVDGGAPVEIDLRGNTPIKTTGQEIVDSFNAAAGFEFAKLVVLGALIDFRSSTTGPTSDITFYPTSSPAQDASALVLGLDPNDLPISYPKFKFEYQLDDKYIVAIPNLRDAIRDDSVGLVLSENTDYVIEFGSGIISFLTAPPAALWAKDNLVNLETPYNNFGYLMDIYNTNKESYLKAIKGLWYAFWTGPRPENMRIALYLLFGLPVMSLDGVVKDITATDITVTYLDGSEEVFAIPSGLKAIVGIGDELKRFTPLVDGISVVDKINKPGFLEDDVGVPGIEPFLTENASRGAGPDTDETKALKTVAENSYLPQIDVNAFISPDISLANVKTFLKNIQPKSRTFLFQVVVGIFSDELVFGEDIGLDINIDVTPNLDSNPNTFAQQSDLNDAEVNPSITLDSEVIGVGEKTDIEVYHSAVLVDSFTIEG